ncbi:MAG: hypothetical protein SFU98_01160 [Leptospiraceae bacterium]|nr:hypothetical protein [Leptospiraceae bacterium]
MNKNLGKLVKDLPTVLSFHITAVNGIRGVLTDSSQKVEVREILQAQYDEINSYLVKIDSSYSKFIENLVGAPFQREIDKQSKELFADSNLSKQKQDYVRIKIVFEWVSSFIKNAETSWNSIIGLTKIFNTYIETSSLQKKMESEFLTKVFDLNQDTKFFLNAIEAKYKCRIIGLYAKDKDVLISNLIFEEDKDYDMSKLVEKEEEEEISLKTIAKPFSKGAPMKVEFHYTEVKGTKDWNRNDAYILYVKTNDVKEEEQKFYSSSFVILNPAENANINLAAALVRKNTGYAAAPKYNKMVTTLLEFIVSNLTTKDFNDLGEDTHSFLYHIGPVVIWNIIQDDLIRRDFGHCHYVEKNSIIKFFPENIIKKHIIDFWAEKFFDLKTPSVDSYINFSKGVASVRESYKILFDQAASTRKRISNESSSIEDYLKENTGKFFGYRRAQVYRRFVSDCVWGALPENNSSELVNKFKK